MTHNNRRGEAENGNTRGKWNAQRAVASLVFLVMVMACAFAIGRNDSAARKKARYYYSAGMVEQATGREDAAYEYFKKAYRTDPTYEEAAMAYGTRRMGIGMDTLQSDTELDRSLAMARTFVDRYPADLYESQFYGYLAGQAGDTGEAIRVLERAWKFHPERSGILVMLSEVYAHDGDLDKAVEALTRYERQEGLQPPITTRKLSYLLADKDTAGAIREVTRLVDSDPTSSTYRILKGNVFDIISMPDSSLVYFQEAERLDPESGAAKLALAGYYHQRGDSVAYDGKMYEVLLTEDLDLEQKVDLVAQYLQMLMTGSGDTKRGDYVFSVLREQYPHEPRVLDLAARYSAAKQDFADAEEQIAYALDLDPTNMIYWGQLMTYQSAAGDYDKALSTFEKAESHITPDDNLKFLYASVAQTAGKYDTALKVYRDMIAVIEPSLQPDSVLTLRDVSPDISLDNLNRLAQLLASMGDLYHEAGEKEKSYRAYENALTFDSSNSMAANNYAYFLCIEGGDLDKAEKLSGSAISGLDGENPTYLDTYAWILFCKGDSAKAEEIQRAAVGYAERDGYRSAELYDHLGDILLKNGQPGDALEAWRKAVEIQEKSEDTDKPEYKATMEKIKETEPLVRELENQKAADKEENMEPAEEKKIK